MMHSPRLAFVSNTLWSIVHFRMKVVRDQLERGCFVILIAPEDDTLTSLPVHDRLVFVPLNHLRAHGRSPVADLRLRRELEKVYLAWKPDIIFHYTVKPNIWGTLAARVLPDARTVSVITGLGHAFQSSGTLHMAVSWLYRKALKQATEVWFLNTGDRDLFRRNGMLKGHQGTLMPGEGIDCGKFAPCPLPSQAGSVGFLMIARVKHSKGVREYVEAANILQRKYRDADIQFHYIGKHDGRDPDAVPYATFLEWTNGTPLDWWGHQPDVREAISHADVVVLPSHGEGLSLSLMEGASCERPLITTDVPGCRELVIDGESGWICKPGDAKALAVAMEAAFLATPEERQQMGKKGRALMLSAYDDRVILSHYQERITALCRMD